MHFAEVEAKNSLPVDESAYIALMDEVLQPASPRRCPTRTGRVERRDLLVVGSGIAGLVFALRAAAEGREVSVLTKGQADDTATRWAQGGIASVIAPGDHFEAHIEDTLAAGDGLCDLRAVRVLVEDGPEAVQDLVDWGVAFTRMRGPRSPFDLHLEGGHGTPRILHAGDITGAEIERALLAAARATPRIEIIEGKMAMELVTRHFLSRAFSDQLTCHGVHAFDRATGDVETWLSTGVVLCTGGIGQAYQHTTNPSVATGDGIAMAWRAGARVADLEFVQFHPTQLYDPVRPSFLVSEAVRGAGAVLCDAEGIRVMEGEHPLEDLAPRDVVARTIDRRMKERGDSCVFLDATKLGSGFRRRFPTIHARCLEAGFNPAKQPIPVVPSAHYVCGGVKTDLRGRTSIRGLYAVGECARTGVHGANRLASNSLLEAVVFAKRAAEDIVRNPLPLVPSGIVNCWDGRGTIEHREEVVIRHLRDSVQRVMWDFVGIVRTTDRLKRAARHLRLIRDEVEVFYKGTSITPSLLELRNVVRTARLVVECALRRRESRGLHRLLDHPGHRPGPARPSILWHRV